MKMKTIANIIKSFIAAGLIAGSISAQAQSLHTGYFLESMVQRHELNPAFDANSGYFMLPVFGGIQLGVHTNFGVGNYLFKRGDALVTGLSSQVSAQEFLGGLPTNNQMYFSFDMPILSVGFHAFGGFNTIVLKERTSLDVNIPSSLFAFLKKGEDPTTGIAHYDIDDLLVSTNNYVEVALGHSRKLDALEGFSYGAKLKLLLGALNASVHMQHLGLDLSQEHWMVTGQGEAIISSGAQFVTNEDGTIENVGIDNIRMGGFGFGVDLGVVYTPAALPDLTVSAAVTDLGFINYTDMAHAVTTGTYEYTGFENVGSDDQAPLDEQLNDMLNDVVDVFNLRGSDPVSRHVALKSTLNVGAEYSVLNRKISFGLLSSSRFGGVENYTEGMAVVNFRPIPQINLAINGSLSTFGGALGALLHICPKGFNFFIGCDYISPSSRFAVQGLPINGLNLNLRTGIAFTFAHRNR